MRSVKREYEMANVERTGAGFQMIIPGCEPRTLRKSATRSDDSGQGLLQFFEAPTLKEKLELLAQAPLDSARALKRRRGFR
jgi:hypothetical protein